MPPTTDPAAATRRRAAALSGHQGDERAARAATADADPAVRATALGALARMGRLTVADADAALADADPVVRARAAESLVVMGPAHSGWLVEALADPDATVVEAACFALGEIGAPALGPDDGVVAGLERVAGHHPDPLCREAAVAALGAIGDERGLPAILAATADKPAIRRRAVLALAPFAGPEVDAALERARGDRDWQVRQAAEDLS